MSLIDFFVPQHSRFCFQRLRIQEEPRTGASTKIDQVSTPHRVRRLFQRILVCGFFQGLAFFSVLQAYPKVHNDPYQRLPIQYQSLYEPACLGWIEVCQAILKRASSNVNELLEGFTPLHGAAYNGQLLTCRLLVENGADLSIHENYHQMTPLHLAIHEKQIPVSLYLIKQPQKNHLYLKNAQGLNALHIATQLNLKGICELLIIEGLPVDSLSEKNDTALHWAARFGFQDLCQMLLEHQAHPRVQNEHGFTPLHLAAQMGHVAICQLLIEHHASCQDLTNQKETPLHLAAQRGHVAICQLLIEHHASCQDLTNQKETPLHLAAQMGHVAVCQLLIRHHASGLDSSNEQETPLHLAAQMGHLEICMVLLNHLELNHLDPKKAILTHRESDGNTPLHLAAHGGHSSVCRLFMKKLGYMRHSPVNFYGETPLHLAVLGGHLAICQALINAMEHDCLNIRTGLGSTPFCYAAYAKKTNACKWLYERGADPKIPSYTGTTALHIAVLKKNWRLCRLLCLWGLDPFRQDDHGKTPFFLASHQKLCPVLVLFAKNKKDLMP